MSADAKQNLEQQLWNIANELRGKMGADEFRDYILGFIFYKYLSEKLRHFADRILTQDGIKYKHIDENTTQGTDYLEAVKEETLEKLGCFLKPSELFSSITAKGNADTGEETFVHGLVG